MSRFSDKLNALGEALGVRNQADLARRTGITATALNNFVGTRQSLPSAEVLRRMKRMIPNLNLNWLLEEGETQEMFLNEGSKEVLAAQKASLADLENRIGELERMNNVLLEHIDLLKKKG
jgi:transcriptional regulator with XRE-family HTH domain